LRGVLRFIDRQMEMGVIVISSIEGVWGGNQPC
jgi:hypothetical protein